MKKDEKKGKSTSVGFPINPAIPPANPAQVIVEAADNSAVFERCLSVGFVSYGSISLLLLPLNLKARKELPSRVANICITRSMCCFEDWTCIRLCKGGQEVRVNLVFFEMGRVTILFDPSDELRK